MWTISRRAKSTTTKQYRIWNRLAGVRARMSAADQLHVVEGGDHSLVLTKTALKAIGTTQDAVNAAVVARLADFIRGLAHTP